MINIFTKIKGISMEREGEGWRTNNLGKSFLGGNILRGDQRSVGNTT